MRRRHLIGNLLALLYSIFAIKSPQKMSVEPWILFDDKSFSACLYILVWNQFCASKNIHNCNTHIQPVNSPASLCYTGRPQKTSTHLLRPVGQPGVHNDWSPCPGLRLVRPGQTLTLQTVVIRLMERRGMKSLITCQKLSEAPNTEKSKGHLWSSMFSI